MTILDEKRIACIGAGYMGGAIIGGLVASGAVAGSQIVAADLNNDALALLAQKSGIATTSDNNEAIAESDIVLLAVKPQVLSNVLGGIKEASAEKLFISVAAGVSTKTIEDQLHPSARVVRTMPNMGAVLGAAASAIAAGSSATKNDVTVTEAIFNLVGIAVVVDEDQIDAVTGLSGSGPAYVFLFLAALIDGGIKAGLSREVAQKLAEQTLLGSAMLAQQSDETPEELIKKITSPGGTTLAGLATLNETGFAESVTRGIASAVARSKELGAT